MHLQTCAAYRNSTLHGAQLPIGTKFRGVLLLLAHCVFIWPTIASCQEPAKLNWLTDLATAKAQAQQDDKFILAIVSGGDCTEAMSEDNCLRAFDQVLEFDTSLRESLRQNYVLYCWTAGAPKRLFSQRLDAIAMSERRMLLAVCDAQTRILKMMIGLPTAKELNTALQTASLADLTRQVGQAQESGIARTDKPQRFEAESPPDAVAKFYQQRLSEFWISSTQTLHDRWRGIDLNDHDSPTWQAAARSTIELTNSAYVEDQKIRLGFTKRDKGETENADSRTRRRVTQFQAIITNGIRTLVTPPKTTNNITEKQQMILQSLDHHAANRWQMCQAIMSFVGGAPFDSIVPIVAEQVWQQRVWRIEEEGDRFVEAIEQRLITGRPVLIKLRDDRLQSVRIPVNHRQDRILNDLKILVDKLDAISIGMTDLGWVAKQMNWSPIDLSVPNPARFIVFEAPNSIEIIRAEEIDLAVIQKLRKIMQTHAQRRELAKKAAAIR